jgi:hypothetical protein
MMEDEKASGEPSWPFCILAWAGLKDIEGNETWVSYMADDEATESSVFILDQADAEQSWSAARPD